MKYDSRIVSHTFFTPFDSYAHKLAKDIKGFFASDESYWENLDKCTYSTLAEVIQDEQAYSPYIDADGKAWKYFLPANNVKMENVKVPLTPEEFRKKFDIGDRITIRHIESDDIEETFITGFSYRDKCTPYFIVHTGSSTFYLTNLVHYVYKDSDGNWCPLYKMGE